MSGAVVFFGYGHLGRAGLNTLVSVGAQISAVVVPENREGPKVDMMREAADRCSVPVLIQPRRRAVEPFVDALRSLQPDLMVVWSYSLILPRSVLSVAPKGAVNVHGGLLPQYRGGHVTQWAIINGESEFGVTLHYIDEGVDTGPVIAEHRFALGDTDDAYSVRLKLADAGSRLLTAWWPRLIDGTAPRVAQDESQARYWPLRTPEQGRITWTMPAPAISCLVRALCANSPGAYVESEGRRIRVRHAIALQRLKEHARPGEVVAADARGVRIAAQSGDVLVIAADDINGRTLPPDTLARMLAYGDL